MTAIVLAGGLSSRLGQDKALIPWRGKPLILHVLAVLKPLFATRLVVTKRPADYRDLPGLEAEVVEDTAPQHHPLVGLATGLERSSAEHSFICACDMPLLQPALVRALCAAAGGCDAVVPLRAGRPEPLCGVYSRACLEPSRAMQADPALGLCDLLKRVKTRFLTEEEVSRVDPEGRSFIDIDTPEEYNRLIGSTLP